MDKTAIKNFAIWARRELIEKVSQRAKIYGIEKDKEMKEMDTALNGQVLTSDDKKARKILIEKIEKDGFAETIEEVAYTWFNRFIAIRFMEVNGYMPSHIRVFTSENNEFEPQILSEAIHIDLPGLDKSKVLDLYNAGNKEEELFKYLFITQCNALNEVLPGMFQKINDYTELLLPDGLLRDDSVIDVMIREIPEEDWKEQVQIIGWLYQYYNTEPKDEVFSRPKSKKIQKEDIPAATQLFTPDWIVRYMVENSLGRLWIEGHPDDELKENWKYYIEEAEQEKEVEEQLSKIRKEYAEIKPEDIKCIDPAIGSGHIGAYLFDVLIQIYESCGYKRRDAVRLILENNIYGLDIDERARQLAYFSLMMKARQYDRRFLSRKDIPQPKVYAIEESNFFKTENGKNIIEYFANGDNDLRKNISSIVEDMMDAKEYGSIVIVNPVNFEAIYKRFEEIRNEESLNLYRLLILEQLLPLVKQAEILSDKYDIVITNPPYMGNASVKLGEYLKINYLESKYDLYGAFIVRGLNALKRNGFEAMITGDSWLSIKSFNEMRKKLINQYTFQQLLHLGNGAFDCGFGTVSFVIRNSYLNYNVVCQDLRSSIEKKDEFHKEANKKYIVNFKTFNKIPYMPIAYWINKKLIKIFNTKSMRSQINTKAGIVTGNNKKFMKLWYEVNYNDINFKALNHTDMYDTKWVPTHKGSGYRKWFGNIEYIVSLRDLWDDTKVNKSVRRGDKEFYFKEGITWSTLSNVFGARKSDTGFVCDTKGSMAFPKDIKKLYNIIGVLNSDYASQILKILSPNLDFNKGYIEKIPFIEIEDPEFEKIVKRNIDISRLDWNRNETSWGFRTTPLLEFKNNGCIEDAYNLYKKENNFAFNAMMENEKNINKIVSDIYDISQEYEENFNLSHTLILDEQKYFYNNVTTKKFIKTKQDVIKEFLSFFVGCCMGRYSLDEEGLIFAGGEFDSSKYRSFKADKDGILPITDKEYFEDDIVELFVKFLKITFGEEHLNENLDFIASELKGKKSDSSRERIRNYFLNDFYEDHCKMYQKLPIYWQYDSGKNGACRGLFYLHRYDKDMFAKIRINYVFEVQDRYKQELVRVEDTIAESSGNKKIELQKRADALKKKIIESQQFEEKAQHIADSYIEIDLDDGVKENYKIFKDVLAKIK